MGWRTIYIEENNYLSLYLDNLKIKNKNEDEYLLPLKDIDMIVMDNYKATISINLLIKCSEYNIDLIICDLNHLPICQTLSFAGNCLASKILSKQLAWDIQTKGQLWKKIVYYKINNQVEILKHNKRDNNYIDMINNLKNDIELFDSTNREGLCAKIYFRALFGDNFKRFNDDTLNAGLNYGYSILRTMISRSLVSKGLNCMIGIFHKGESNNFNLSDDIIEVFRPIIDDFVYNNLNNSIIFSRDIRLKLIKLLGGKIIINNKKQTISNAIDIYIDSIINHFENGDAVCFPSVIVYDV